jgi:riboflavin synthase
MSREHEPRATNMFTGIIEDVGTVRRSQIQKRSAVLSVSTHLPLEEIPVGSSIAVNGTCLTVMTKDRHGFKVDVSPETLRRTNLKELRPGSPINLERPLRLNDRLGGHLVTGHIDGVAVVEQVKRQRQFTFMSYRVSTPLFELLVPKGSVAVDGISLTVNECEKHRFSVTIVPFTLQRTNLQGRRVGDKVNIETDIIGKYVRRLLALERKDSR